MYVRVITLKTIRNVFSSESTLTCIQLDINKNIQIALQYEYTIYTIEKNIKIHFASN